jgi:hypothetical protein
MNDQQDPQDKVPWPGTWALQRCCWYYNGLISDKSGADAINQWATTASQEEKEAMYKQAHALGYAEGLAFGKLAVDAIWRFLFG